MKMIIKKNNIYKKNNIKNIFILFLLMTFFKKCKIKINKMKLKIN